MAEWLVVWYHSRRGRPGDRYYVSSCAIGGNHPTNWLTGQCSVFRRLSSTHLTPTILITTAAAAAAAAAEPCRTTTSCVCICIRVHMRAYVCLKSYLCRPTHTKRAQLLVLTFLKFPQVMGGGACPFHIAAVLYRSTQDLFTCNDVHRPIAL